MEDQLLLLSGHRAAVTLVAKNSMLVVTRRAAPFALAMLFAFSTLLIIGLLLFGVVCIWIMLKVAVTETSLLAFVVCVVFFAAYLPGCYAFLSIQSLLFPFEARIDVNHRFYLLKNGFKIARLALAGDATVSIVPVYSHGAWGCAVNLKRGRNLCSWPVVPSTVIGTKHDAFVEAERVKLFIESAVLPLRVVLDQWGTTQIGPNVEYIR